MTDTIDVRPRFRVILIIDAVINLFLGIMLMIFPNTVISFLGLPITYEPFYTSVLGAVLIGIAVALVIECVRERTALGGLGISGAIAINVCGACVIVLWLVSRRLVVSLRGYFVLWILVFILLIISGIELIVAESAPVEQVRDTKGAQEPRLHSESEGEET